jgi:D-sedoheptulose 7-phosphate isomerase
MTVIALTGRSGGELKARADLVVHVPSDRIEVVEDAHQIMAHSLCVAARERLAEGSAKHGRATLRVVTAGRPAR